MSARATLIAALLLSGTVAVVAAPRPVIQPGDLPGRERERFIDPFPPPPATSQPLFVTPKRTAKPGKRACKKHKKC